jgi:hypothetical protein
MASERVAEDLGDERSAQARAGASPGKKWRRRASQDALRARSSSAAKERRRRRRVDLIGSAGDAARRQRQRARVRSRAPPAFARRTTGPRGRVSTIWFPRRPVMTAGAHVSAQDPGQPSGAGNPPPPGETTPRTVRLPGEGETGRRRPTSRRGRPAGQWPCAWPALRGPGRRWGT